MAASSKARATTHSVIERRRMVTELLRKRYRVNEIAKLLGVNPSVVRLDIKSIESTWQSEMVDDYNLVRIRELIDLDDMERDCIDRLGKLQPHQGARLIEERRKIKEFRAKLLGLEAPKKIDVDMDVKITSEERKRQVDAVVWAALGGRFAAVMNVAPELPALEAPEAQIPVVLEKDENVPELVKRVLDSRAVEDEIEPIENIKKREMSNKLYKLLAEDEDFNA